MGIRQRDLGHDEYVVDHMRTHAKALFLPAITFVLLSTALGVGLALLPASVQPWASWTLVGAAVLLVVLLVGRPALKWLTTTYTLTNHRLITRTGIFNRRRHDLPLARINDITYERSLTDRMLGCGTLIVTNAAETRYALPDVPQVKDVHAQLSELIYGNWNTPIRSRNDLDV